MRLGCKSHLFPTQKLYSFKIILSSELSCIPSLLCHNQNMQLHYNIFSISKFTPLTTCFPSLSISLQLTELLLCSPFCLRFTDVLPLTLPIFLTPISKKGAFHSWALSCVCSGGGRGIGNSWVKRNWMNIIKSRDKSYRFMSARSKCSQ